MWAKQNNELAYWMWGIVIICALGAASAIFPIIDIIVSAIVIFIVGTGALFGLAYLVKFAYDTHKLDSEPISPEEVKDNG